MTSIASILDGLIAVINGWTVDVLAATAADIEARAGKDTHKPS
ncbi:hypothetical protein [uncultured Methylovirgula sp.]|nr:hypothetical protein [uncultured Methylovirgula sp.]